MTLVIKLSAELVIRDLTKVDGDGNERFNEQYNSVARALSILVRFYVVLCKTTT